MAERKPATDCASEQAALDRLRADPSIDEAQAFWRGLQCERLRPQARMLMESLDIVVEEPSPHPVLGDASTALSPKANDIRAVVAPGDSVAADPARLRPREARTRAPPSQSGSARRGTLRPGNDLRRAEAASRAASGQPERLTASRRRRPDARLWIQALKRLLAVHREGDDVLRVEIHCHEIDHADAAVVISAEVEALRLEIARRRPERVVGEDVAMLVLLRLARRASRDVEVVEDMKGASRTASSPVFG